MLKGYPQQQASALSLHRCRSELAPPRKRRWSPNRGRYCLKPPFKSYILSMHALAESVYCCHGRGADPPSSFSEHCPDVGIRIAFGALSPAVGTSCKVQLPVQTLPTQLCSAVSNTSLHCFLCLASEDVLSSGVSPCFASVVNPAISLVG